MKAQMVPVPDQVIKADLMLEMTAKEWRAFSVKVESISVACPFFPFKKEIVAFVRTFVPRERE